MALANYGDLKTSVASWMARSDLSSVIPDFVALCHSQIMRDLRGHPRLRKINTNFSITGEYVAVPSDFMELVAARLNGSRPMTLTYRDYDAMTDWYSGEPGLPIQLTVTGNPTSGTEMFRFAPVPTSGYTMTLEYYARLAFFANDGATNWILTDFPGVYLYGTMHQAGIYLKDAQAAEAMLRLYERELGALTAQGKRSLWSRNSMTARAG